MVLLNTLRAFFLEPDAAIHRDDENDNTDQDDDDDDCHNLIFLWGELDTNEIANCDSNQIREHEMGIACRNSYATHNQRSKQDRLAVPEYDAAKHDGESKTNSDEKNHESRGFVFSFRRLLKMSHDARWRVKGICLS